MLSLVECRKILGYTEEQMSDDQLIQIRDSLYTLANRALDNYMDEVQQKRLQEKSS